MKISLQFTMLIIGADFPSRSVKNADILLIKTDEIPVTAAMTYNQVSGLFFHSYSNRFKRELRKEAIGKIRREDQIFFLFFKLIVTIYLRQRYSISRK